MEFYKGNQRTREFIAALRMLPSDNNTTDAGAETRLVPEVPDSASTVYTSECLGPSDA
jgi:hypothetical protein